MGKVCSRVGRPVEGGSSASRVQRRAAGQAGTDSVRSRMCISSHVRAWRWTMRDEAGQRLCSG